MKSEGGSGIWGLGRLKTQRNCIGRTTSKPRSAKRSCHASHGANCAPRPGPAEPRGGPGGSRAAAGGAVCPQAGKVSRGSATTDVRGRLLRGGALRGPARLCLSSVPHCDSWGSHKPTTMQTREFWKTQSYLGQRDTTQIHRT